MFIPLILLSSYHKNSTQVTKTSKLTLFKRFTGNKKIVEEVGKKCIGASCQSTPHNFELTPKTTQQQNTIENSSNNNNALIIPVDKRQATVNSLFKNTEKSSTNKKYEVVRKLDVTFRKNKENDDAIINLQQKIKIFYQEHENLKKDYNNNKTEENLKILVTHLNGFMKERNNTKLKYILPYTKEEKKYIYDLEIIFYDFLKRFQEEQMLQELTSNRFNYNLIYVNKNIALQNHFKNNIIKECFVLEDFEKNIKHILEIKDLLKTRQLTIQDVICLAEELNLVKHADVLSHKNSEGAKITLEAYDYIQKNNETFNTQKTEFPVNILDINNCLQNKDYIVGLDNTIKSSDIVIPSGAYLHYGIFIPYKNNPEYMMQLGFFTSTKDASTSKLSDVQMQLDSNNKDRNNVEEKEQRYRPQTNLVLIKKENIQENIKFTEYAKTAGVLNENVNDNIIKAHAEHILKTKETSFIIVEPLEFTYDILVKLIEIVTDDYLFKFRKATQDILEYKAKATEHAYQEFIKEQEKSKSNYLKKMTENAVNKNLPKEFIEFDLILKTLKKENKKINAAYHYMNHMQNKLQMQEQENRTKAEEFYNHE